MRKVVSKRYAKALFSVAKMSKKEKETKDFLNSFITLVKFDRKVYEMVFFPSFPKDVRKRCVEKICKLLNIPRYLKNFFSLLIEKGRMSHLEDIALAYGEILDEESGIRRVEVVVPIELDDNQKEYVVEKIKKIFGFDIRVEFSLDETILGGFILKVKDIIYDASIKAQLERMLNI